MSQLNKAQIIGIALAVIIIIIGGIFYLGSESRKQGNSPAKQNGEGNKIEEPAEVILSLAGEIITVEADKNFFTVKPVNQEMDVKVNIDEATEIIQLKFPFDPENPPAESTFTPERVPITLADLGIGEHILLEAEANIAGKAEISGVVRIQVLP